MKKLVVMATVVISAVFGARWWKQRSADKASWSTATDPLD
ncbi:MAG: DLW-39 family protein [Galactobacter sp.]|nr:DLW-39 family protein [Galactobacter sp.]